jgi:hypothetical protein
MTSSATTTRTGSPPHPRRPDGQDAAQRPHPVGDFGHSRRTILAIVLHGNGQAPVAVRGGNGRVGRAAPGRVLDGPGHHQVRGRLDHLRVAGLDGVVELDRDRRTVGQRRECRTETRLGQDGWIDAVRQLPELTEPGLHGGQRLLQEEPGRVVHFGLGARVRQADVVRQGQEPLLRAVVKVSFEPASFRVAGLDDPRPRGPDFAELTEYLRLETLIFQAETDSGAEFPLELGECRRVADHGYPPVLLHQRGDQAPRCGGRLGDRPALGIDIAPGVREPVGDAQLRITQRPRERRFERTRSGRLAEARHDTRDAAAVDHRHDGVAGQPGREQDHRGILHVEDQLEGRVTRILERHPGQRDRVRAGRRGEQERGQGNGREHDVRPPFPGQPPGAYRQQRRGRHRGEPPVRRGHGARQGRKRADQKHVVGAVGPAGGIKVGGAEEREAERGQDDLQEHRPGQHAGPGT